jgi:hypothetical protein
VKRENIRTAGSTFGIGPATKPLHVEANSNRAAPPECVINEERDKHLESRIKVKHIIPLEPMNLKSETLNRTVDNPSGLLSKLRDVPLVATISSVLPVGVESSLSTVLELPHSLVSGEHRSSTLPPLNKWLESQRLQAYTPILRALNILELDKLISMSPERIESIIKAISQFIFCF